MISFANAMIEPGAHFRPSRPQSNITRPSSAPGGWLSDTNGAYIDYNVIMSHVLSLRLAEQQALRLKKYARRLGRTPGETGRILLDEALRQIEFPLIEFRDSPRGRQAYVKGRRSTVWMVMLIARSYKYDAKKTARHFEWPLELVEAAVQYAKAFPEEIEDALKDVDDFSFEEFQRSLAAARTTKA